MTRASLRVVLRPLILTTTITACSPSGRRSVLMNKAFDHATPELFANLYPAREGETPYDAIDFLDASEKDERRNDEDEERMPGSPGLDPIKGFRAQDFQQPIDWAAVREPRGVQVSWLGHASFLVQLGDVDILTDPVFTELPFSWLFDRLERVSPSVVSAGELGFVDAVVISHNHYDHLDFDTLEDLPRKVRYFVPLRVGRHFGSHFREVTDMDWYTTARLGDVAITALPAQHRSARTYWDHNETLWAGWLFEHRGKKVYFAGDTGYSRIFEDIHARVGDIDVCLMPIIAYRPYRYRRGHLTPEWAVEAAVALHCKTLVPWGYGTFTLGHEHVLEPLRRLEKAHADIAPSLPLRPLRMGETASFE